jgi:hypothetical protein
METDSDGLPGVCRGQSGYAETVFQRPEESTTVSARCSNGIGEPQKSNMENSRDMMVGTSLSGRETEEIHDPDPEHSRNDLA